MRAGSLRHHLSIRSEGEHIRTPGKTPQDQPGTDGFRWGSVEGLDGAEFEQARTIDANATIKVRIRHFPGLTPLHWFLHGSRKLHIVKILPDKRGNEFQECWCKEDL